MDIATMERWSRQKVDISIGISKLWKKKQKSCAGFFQEVAEGTAYTDVARGLNYDRIPAPETVAVKARKRTQRKDS